MHVFDDAWVTGMIEAKKVVVPPFFGYETTYYSYRLHEKRVRYEKDSNGKLRRVETWHLVHSESNSVPFIVNDGTGTLILDPQKAIIKFPHGQTFQSEWWRHEVTYFPAEGIVSTVGVLTEDKNQLTPKGEVPMMITPMGRKSFMQSIKMEERFAKYGGLTSLWSSFGVGFASLFEHLGFAQNWDWRMQLITFGSMGTVPFAAFYYHITYNSLVQFRQRILNSWSNVDVELKLRRDLLPELVQVAKGYMGHEHVTLVKLSGLRESISKERRLSEKIRMENEISTAISEVVAVAEAQPNLKNESMMKIQQELAVLENKIAHAKSHYNAVTEEYNSLVEGFPARVLAKRHQFRSVPYYGAKPEELAAKKVEPKLAAPELRKDLPDGFVDKTPENASEKTAA